MKFNLLYILLVIVILSACSSKKPVTSTSLKSASYEHIKNTLQLTDKEMHTPLYEFIAEWYGVPYKYGECSKNGIPQRTQRICTKFTKILYQKLILNSFFLIGVALSGLEMVWIYFHRALPCAIVFCPFGATHILSLRDTTH
jgi:hypothetical protein